MCLCLWVCPYLAMLIHARRPSAQPIRMAHPQGASLAQPQSNFYYHSCFHYCLYCYFYQYYYSSCSKHRNSQKPVQKTHAAAAYNGSSFNNWWIVLFPRLLCYLLSALSSRMLPKFVSFLFSTFVSFWRSSILVCV